MSEKVMRIAEEAASKGYGGTMGKWDKEITEEKSLKSKQKREFQNVKNVRHQMWKVRDTHWL